MTRVQYKPKRAVRVRARVKASLIVANASIFWVWQLIASGVHLPSLVFDEER